MSWPPLCLLTHKTQLRTTTCQSAAAKLGQRIEDAGKGWGLASLLSTRGPTAGEVKA